MQNSGPFLIAYSGEGDFYFKTPMKPQTTRCVIYSRRESNLSEDVVPFDEQIDICRKHASENRFVVRQEFADQGISHKLKEIDNLFRYLLATSDVDLILVATLDRILYSTNAKRLYKYARELEDAQRTLNVSVVSKSNEAISLTKFKDLLLEIIHSEEKLIKDQKRLFALRKYALEGGWIGVLPIGYERIANNEPSIKEGDDLKLIKEAFKMKLTNAQNRKILKFLNENGIAINIDTLGRILKNIFYTGYFRKKLTGDKLVRGNYNGIISLEEFEKIQLIYRRRRRKSEK
jgi:DNA invertase Pin-like site-specific DNA recombinase